MIIHVWICYPISPITVIWGIGHVWQGLITPQTTAWPPTTPQICSAVFFWILEPRAGTMHLIIGIVVQEWWHRYGYSIPLLYECYMSVSWGMAHIWHGWITPYITIWPPTSHHTSSPVTQIFGTNNLNHAPHQWCSSPRMMVQVWICYPTVIWVVYDAFITSYISGSPSY